MNSIIRKNLQGITAASVEKYLFFTGWNRDPTITNVRMWVFYKTDDPEFRLAIPASENNRDFYSRLYDIILTLSDYQNKSVEEIINSLKSAYTDRIQFRVISDSTKDGKMPLSYAAQCLEGLKDLVLYAACAEENAQPICARACNSAKNRLDRFQFGQTEYGSFVFNIDVQVVEEDNEQFYIPEITPELPESKEHNIIKRIRTAIDQVDRIATRQVQIGEILDTAYNDGITANMCEAMSKLRPLDDCEVSVETTFYFAEALSRSVEQPIRNTLENVHFLFLDEISKRYRDRTLVEDVTLKGIIKMLSKDSSPDSDGVENTVRLLAKVDNQLRSIKLHLSSDDHTAACNAYRDDKEVEVTGTLDKSQKYWFFSSIESFNVID